MQNLDEVKRILFQFQANLEKKQAFYESMRTLNPNFDSVSEDHCQKDLARCRIYGTDNIGTILMAQLPKIPYHSEVSKSLASKHYNKWQTIIEKNALPDSEYTEYFLNDEEFANYHFDEPKAGETLYNYILRLQDIVENKEKISFLWERGLSSFFHYLRQKIPKDQIAFLELIFPENMEIRKISMFKEFKTGKLTSELREVPFGQIARKNPPCVYPIFIMTAADIIHELANTALHGRKNAKLVAAEALGLCWICFTSARLRLPIAVKDLLNLSPMALEKPLDKLLPCLSLPTIFGRLPVPISETIWSFLKALSEIPGTQPRSSIFQCSEGGLYRCLRRIIKKLGLNPAKGKITFKTFLSQAVEFDHRYQPKITH